ncbi:unnamed protein product [Meloidogyne enterolobii]|uniref:Uncharacterized protein n=1 Tax=Meloidogyne enterolobii TaxID=390850 RepID=A0ACB1APJ0_MELEN
MQHCNSNGSDDEDDQKCLATTTPFDGQVLILSESGKPIFYSKGDEDEICSFFGVISIIVQRYHSLGNEDGRDSLLSIQRRDLFFQFLYRSPLILCLVSKQPCNLHIQLDTIYNQVSCDLRKRILLGNWGPFLRERDSTTDCHLFNELFLDGEWRATIKHLLAEGQGSVGNDEGVGNRNWLKSRKSEISLNFRKLEGKTSEFRPTPAEGTALLPLFFSLPLAPIFEYLLSSFG